MQLTIKSGLHFYFFTLSKGIDDAVFPWLRFVDDTLSHSIFFSITCTSVTGGIMITEGSCGGVSIIDTENARVRERHECISEV